MRCVVLLVIFFCGCTNANISMTKLNSDGTLEKCEASYSSVWEDSSATSLSGCGAKGEAENNKTSEIAAQALVDILMAQ